MNPFKNNTTKKVEVTYNSKRTKSLMEASTRIDKLVASGYLVSRHERNDLTGYNCVLLSNAHDHH